MFLYFAHPIDHSGREYTNVRVALTDAGHTVYDPAWAWHLPQQVTPKVAQGVIDLNLGVLSQVEAVVALMNPGDLSLGVYEEIRAAAALRLPVFLLWQSDAPIGLALLRFGDRLKVYSSGYKLIQALEGEMPCETS